MSRTAYAITGACHSPRCIADASCSRRETLAAFIAATGCSVNRDLPGKFRTGLHPGSAGFCTTCRSTAAGQPCFRTFAFSMARAPRCRRPPMFWSEGAPLNAFLRARFPSMLIPMSGSLPETGEC